MKRIVTILLAALMVMPLFAYSDAELKEQLKMNNLDIQSARREADMARLDVKDAKAGYSPTIKMTATGTYMTNPPVGPVVLSTDQIAGDLGIALPESGYVTVFPGMENTLYNISAQLTQPIFTWGKISKSVDLFEEIYDVRQINVLNQTRMLSSQLEGLECAMYYLGLMKDNLSSQMETARQLVDMTKSASEAGMVVQQDYMDARLSLSQIDVGISTIEQQMGTQLLALEKLTGLELTVDDIEYVPDEAQYAALLDTEMDVLLEKALNPALDTFQMLNGLVKVSETANSLARSDIYYKPDFALMVQAGYGGSRFPLIEQDWYRKDSGSFNITFAIQSTLWDGGKKSNNIARTSRSIEGAKSDVLAARQEIREQLSSQILAMQLAQSQIAYEQMKIENAELKNENEKLLYESGYSDSIKLLQIELEKKGYEFAILQYRLQMAASYHTVMFLIGGTL